MIDQIKIPAKAKMLKDVLVEVKVEADLSGMLWRKYWHYTNPLELAEDLERAVKDFHDFLRDHRSQDMVTLNVVRIKKNICSVCKEQWEAAEDENGLYCAGCGAIVEMTADKEQEKK